MEHLQRHNNIDTFMNQDSDFFLNVTVVNRFASLLIEKEQGQRLTMRQVQDGSICPRHRMSSINFALPQSQGYGSIFRI